MPDEEDDGEFGMNVEWRRYEGRMFRWRCFAFALLVFLLLGLFVASITFGVFEISLRDIWKAMFGGVEKSDTAYMVVMTMRLPRALSAIAGGAALAVSGLMLQTFFRNPIVESYVLGISTGSSLFVGLVILAGVRLGFTVITPMYLFLGAFLGAIAVLLIVLFFAGRVKNIITLLIIGMMCGYLCNAVISILISYADKENIAAFVSWGMGSFSGIGMDSVKLLYLLTTPMFIFSFALANPLNAFLLGDHYATSMGISVRMLRYCLILISGILTASITAFAGPISFIGLAVPHLCRLLFRTNNLKILIPSSILLGGVMASLCDFLARSLVAPRELPLSAITAFIGAPVIVYLLKNREARSHV